MKGLFILLLCFISLNLQASLAIKAQELKAMRLSSGEIINNLSLQESTKVLKSLDLEQNLEIRARVIYPEEVTGLIVSKLTKARLTEKKPNPQDYN